MKKYQNLSANNTCLGVVGGDLTCIRAMILHWIGRPIKLFKNSVIQIDGKENNKYLVFIISHDVRLKTYPGGLLIWLFPERGPSQPELSQLQQFISNNQIKVQELQILLCMPNEITEKESQSIIETTAETLYWRIDPNIEINLEAVWLSLEHCNNLGNWLIQIQNKK